MGKNLNSGARIIFSAATNKFLTDKGIRFERGKGFKERTALKALKVKVKVIKENNPNLKFKYGPCFTTSTEGALWYNSVLHEVKEAQDWLTRKMK